MSAKRKLFVPLKEKDIDIQGNNRKHMFEELKKTLPNGCFTSFYERDYETDVSSEVPVASNANLLTKLATTCRRVEEFLSQMPVLTDVQVQQILRQSHSIKFLLCFDQS